jgi:GTP-sensing pleiotropic transcriptional regulator CodY
MGRERDDESGKYTDAYSDEDFVQAIEGEDGLVGTGDIADSVGCSHRQALNRLKRLEKRGIVTSEDVGKSLVWRHNESK